MLHGSMLRRKRSMLRTYLLLLWLVAMEISRQAVHYAWRACLLPAQWFLWVVTLQFVAPIAGLLSQLLRHRHRRTRRAVVVFTRLPNPGRTKSQLIPYIGANNAAMVMRILTENLIRRLQPLRKQLVDTDIYLAYKDACHVICEPTVCNRPVQLWMECIAKHREFALPRRATYDEAESLDDGLQENGAGVAPVINNHQNGDNSNGSEAHVQEEFSVFDAMELGAFDRYLKQLKSAPYGSRFDSTGAPSRPLQQQQRHRKSPAPTNSSSSKFSSSTVAASLPTVRSGGATAAAAPLPQSGTSIGATLESALWTLFARGYSQVSLLSSDVPALSDRHALSAFRCLDNGADLVLGKTASGGIYLLGANRASLRRQLGAIFRGVLWGSGSVFEAQCENAARLGITCAALRWVLRDLDTVDDLALLESELGVPSCLFMADAVTVLIPARNEADHIETTLRNLLFNCSRNRPLQIVVVDGRSVDGTAQIVRDFFRHRATSCLPLADLRRVSLEIRRLPDALPTGRGHMIRYGLGFARGAYYLVLHADSSLPESWDDIAVRTLSLPGVIAGAFTFHLKIPNELCFTKDIPWALRTMLLELHTNWRCRRYEMPIGSQGMFLHAYYYAMSGGYKDWPFLEDIEFVERLKTLGHVATADAAVMTSPRRWITHGFAAVCGLNALILLAYRLGIDPRKLGAVYYSVGKSWVRVAR